MITKGISLRDLAVFISDHCRRSGIEVVLSGGACVSIYTHNKYLSYDLNFVLLSHTTRATIRTAMEPLGFYEDGRYFRHPETPYIVEFLSPPLSVGEEPVREIREIRRAGKVLRLLSPTDCAKDRLAAFYYWDDRQSLGQAVLVCRDTEIDLREVERWSAKEGMKDKFSQFKKALLEKKHPR
ncbi:MAG: hypothetical protein ABR951_10290 [Candidatus Aminicenantales bacterium]|jgi:hypothetical protein